MGVRNKLGGGLELIKLNSENDILGIDKLYNKCIMCREDMDESEKTKEHIFPRWLQKKYKLENEKMILPNGTTMKYNQFLVSCCKDCNGGIMSEWENRIKDAVNAGYDEIKKMDINIIAWWIYKLYYSKLVKENQLRNDIRNPLSKKIIDDEHIKQYNCLYMVMSNLIKGISYEGFIPYEIYIFKTEDELPFDYIDDIETNTVYMKMGNIILICCLDSYNIYKIQYKRELEGLKKLDSIHPLQAIELFTKMVYFRRHYGFCTKENYVIDVNGCRMKTEVCDLYQIKEFDLEELLKLFTNVLSLRGVDVSKYKDKDGKMKTFIPE